MSYKAKRNLHAVSDDDESASERNQFLDDEALEDDEEESEDNDELQARLRESTVNSYTKENVTRRDFSKMLDNPEEFVRRAEDRDKFEERQYIEDQQPMDEQYGLPEREENHYPIFSVRCKIGFEQDVAMRIMKVFLTKKDKRNYIQSVYVPQKKTGIVYVEVKTDKKLVDSAEGVRDFYTNSAQKLNDRQMSELLLPRQIDHVDPYSYVRPKTGLYKDDLGIVTDDPATDGCVYVKLVPRFDIKHYQTIARAIRSSNEETDVRKRKAYGGEKNPTKQLFDPDSLGIRDVVSSKFIEDEEEDDGILKFDGKTFYGGFIKRKMKISQLNINNIIPTEDELALFSEGNEKSAKGKLRYNRYETTFRDFKEKDRVRIVTDVESMNGLMATIVKCIEVQGSKFYLIKLDTQQDPIRVSPTEIEIVFSPGDRVKVTAGNYSGETGLVECVKESDESERLSEIVIFTDSTKKSITVSCMDVENTIELNQAIDELGDYHINDYVQIGATVGIILDIIFDKKQFSVLTDTNRVEKINLTAVTGRVIERRDSHCKDRNHNFVSIGETVKIVSGPYNNRSGKLVHIHQFNRLFISCQGIMENNSFIVVGSRDVVGKIATRPEQFYRDNKERNDFDSPSGSRINGRRDGMRGRSGETDHNGSTNKTTGEFSGRELQGKKVVMMDGNYKNYKGKIVRVRGKEIQIELDANGKSIKTIIGGEDYRLVGDVTEKQFTQPSTPMTHGSRSDIISPFTPGVVSTPFSRSTYPNQPQTPNASIGQASFTPKPSYYPPQEPKTPFVRPTSHRPNETPKHF